MLANISQQYMGSNRLLRKTQESSKRMFFMLFIRSRQYIFSYVKTTTKSRVKTPEGKKNPHARKRLRFVDHPWIPWQLVRMGGWRPAFTNWMPLGTCNLFTVSSQGQFRLFRVHSPSCLHSVKIRGQAENKTTGYQKVGFLVIMSKNHHPLF